MPYGLQSLEVWGLRRRTAGGARTECECHPVNGF